MKFTVIIDESRDEEIVIYARERTALIKDIEELIRLSSVDIIGYNASEALKLNAEDTECFTVRDSKVIAITANGSYTVKERLYMLEEILGDSFIKINQSCIVNIKKIDRFSASVGGSLEVITKSGFRDYVSRRCLKSVKERLGLK